LEESVEEVAGKQVVGESLFLDALPLLLIALLAADAATLLVLDCFRTSSELRFLVPFGRPSRSERLKKQCVPALRQP
jgi:hypothetical protein